ncbi:MAG: integrin alpha [Planctomycetota bacterium]
MRPTLWHDVDPSGRLWAGALGRYKISFDAAGASFIPFFGSRAPQNYPVQFRLDAATVDGAPARLDAGATPTRHGDMVAFDRGFAVERYAIRPDGVEQSFVIDALPDRGALVLRIGVESPLTAADAGGSMRFANEHGAVSYGAAVAFDARGARTDVGRVWRDGAIELRVPAAFVAGAELPLVVDPLISATPTFVGGATYGPLEVSAPEVAVDTNGRSIAVFEWIFSAQDTDILSSLWDESGLDPISPYIVEGTTGNWREPQVAISPYSGRALITWRDGDDLLGLTQTMVSPPTFSSRQLLLSTPRVSLLPSILTSPTAAGRAFEWFGDSKVAEIADQDPPSTISEKVVSLPPTVLSRGVSAARIRPAYDRFGGNVSLFRDTGLLSIAPSSRPWSYVDLSISSPRRAVHAGPDWYEFIVAGSALVGANLDVVVQVFRFNDQTFAIQEGPAYNVTRMEPEAPGVPHRDWDQSEVVCEYNGHGYNIAYTEDYQQQGTDFDVLVTTLEPRGHGELRLGESHVYAGGTLNRETQPSFATYAGSGAGPSWRSSLAWLLETTLGFPTAVYTNWYDSIAPAFPRTFTGPGTGFGTDVDSAGDVNGDRIPDVVIADPATQTVTVYSTSDGAVLHTFRPGTFVAGDFDFNADGFDDIAVATTTFIWVYSGQDGSSLTTRTIYPETVHALDACGDLDGDGFDDITFVSQDDSLFPVNHTWYVLFGDSGGGRLTTITPASYVSPVDEYFAVSGGGDVDNDGFDDCALLLSEFGTLKVEVWSQSSPPGSLVRTIAVPVTASGLATYSLACDGDLNADGFADVLVGASNDGAYAFSGRDGTQLYSWSGETGADEFGASVAHAGDVDGDGYGDVVIGAPKGDVGAVDGGYIDVYSGADGRGLLRAWYSVANAHAGTAVATAGDFNGDGLADVLFGTPGLSAGVADLLDVGFFGDVATASTYGTGCAHTTGTPRIGFDARPQIGQTFNVRLRGAPASTLAVFILGVGWGPVPYQGCTLYVNPLFLQPKTTDPNGMEFLPLPIPDDVAFVGGVLDAQWVAIDPGTLANSFSDALTFRIAY